MAHIDENFSPRDRELIESIRTLRARALSAASDAELQQALGQLKQQQNLLKCSTTQIEAEIERRAKEKKLTSLDKVS